MMQSYHHPDPDFLPSRLLFYRFIQDDVEEDLYRRTESAYQNLMAWVVPQLGRKWQYEWQTNIVTAEDPNDFSAAVQLDEESFVEVLDLCNSSQRGASY